MYMLQHITDATEFKPQRKSFNARCAIQQWGSRALDRLERGADGKLMKFKQAKCKVLLLGCGSPGTPTDLVEK